MRFPLHLLFPLLLLSGLLHAQGVEELEHLTIEVNELLANAEAAGSDTEKFSLADQGLRIASDLRYEGGVVRASVLLGQVCARTGRTEEALEYFLKAESKLNPGDNSTPPVLDKKALLAVYLGLGDLFFEEKLYDQAQHYYRRVLALEPRNFPIMEKAADACLLTMQYDSAEVYYKELTRYYKQNANYPRLVKIYQKLANTYSNYGNPGKGLFYYLAIEEIIEYNGYPEERAIMYNNMGRQYAIQGENKRALEYFRKAELQCEYINCDYIQLVYANIGVALHNLGDSKTGIEYLLKAKRELSNPKDSEDLASLEYLIAGVYFSNNDVYNALTHNNEAIRLAKETKQEDLLAKCYRTAADIYYQLYDFENAYESYQQYLIVSDSIRRKEQAKQQHIDQQRYLLTEAAGQIKTLLARQSIKELEVQQYRSEQERLMLKNTNLELERQRQENEVRLLQAQKDVDQGKLRDQTNLALQASQRLRLADQELAAEKQERLIINLRQQEQMERNQRLIDSTRVEQLRRDQDYQRSKQASFQRFVYGLGSLGFTIVVLLGLGWWLARRTGRRLRVQNQKIEAQKTQIEEERHKSDRLLLNILPDEVAQELRARGYATPRFYETATVLFTDFLNFTRLSESLTPEALIDELDACFLGFDEICEKYQLEKIKTIGDAYMCAGGLPAPNDTHPIDAVCAAREMFDWLKKRNETNPNAVFREMRIGIHTGPVIAGVIGKNKFAYDIWGDAVNLAARLEELGEPGRVNISGATYEAVKHRFQCTYRGKKEVHNKGLVDMYFVES